MMTFEYKTRCKGEHCEYYTLRVFRNGEVAYVHTSKNMSYLKEQERKYRGLK